MDRQMYTVVDGCTLSECLAVMCTQNQNGLSSDRHRTGRLHQPESKDRRERERKTFLNLMERISPMSPTRSLNLSVCPRWKQEPRLWALRWCFRELPLVPWSVMYTLASVPARRFFPVSTVTSNTVKGASRLSVYVPNIPHGLYLVRWKWQYILTV